jgi:hypothetical protein
VHSWQCTASSLITKRCGSIAAYYHTSALHAMAPWQFSAACCCGPTATTVDHKALQAVCLAELNVIDEIIPALRRMKAEELCCIRRPCDLLLQGRETKSAEQRLLFIHDVWIFRQVTVVTGATPIAARLSTKVGRSGGPWPAASEPIYTAQYTFLRGPTEFSATAGLRAAEQRGPKE